MSEELPKLDTLIKLMKMTTSDNDAEALVALRKANAALSREGWDWEKLLTGKVKIIADPFLNIPTMGRASPETRQAPASTTVPSRPAPPPPPPTPEPLYSTAARRRAEEQARLTEFNRRMEQERKAFIINEERKIKDKIAADIAKKAAGKLRRGKTSLDDLNKLMDL